MNGATLYTLTTNLLGGNAMDQDLFYQLINMQKNMREMSRDWMKLRTLDTSITFSSNDLYTTGKALPARFLRVYSVFDQQTGQDIAVSIVRSDGSKLLLKPIKQAQAYDYRNIEGYYYIDVKNSTISRTGLTAGTLYLNFLQGTVDITSTLSWGLPPTDGYGVLLAYDVAVESKGVIDWDRINANQIPYSERKIRQLEVNLATWDSLLQKAECGV